ncbi:hypothetical protein Ancab_029447 [Ancistrocladus abbreviatus]
MFAFFRFNFALATVYRISRSPILLSIRNITPLLGSLGLQCQKPQYNLNYCSFTISEVAKDKSEHGHVARLTWLITKLSRECRMVEARKVFDKMPDRDVVTWTIMISGYVKFGMLREARDLFDRVDSVKNVVTWTAMVSGYVRASQIVEAEKLFNAMPSKNVISWNTMIDGYAQNGQVDAALELFEKMRERNVVSWNTVLTALAQCGRVEEARRMFDQMPQRDVVSWTAMVTGLSKNGRIDEARAIFDRMPVRNVVSWNAMVTGYAQNSRVDEAYDLFMRMPHRDAPSWNTMITGFVQNGNLGKARMLFDEMPCKNVVSWTTMITGYVQAGESEEALKIFSDMQMAKGIKSNQGTFVSVLGACSNLAGLSEGIQIHQIICKTTYQHSAFVVSALVNMYSKCGELGTARKMFDDYPSSHKDLVSWNGIITAYAHHGCGTEAIRLFEEMRIMGYKPDDITYVGLLCACSYAGLVEEGLKYFAELASERSIRLREDHYACLIDLCGRAGRLDEAFKFIEHLGEKPQACVWGALLAGCNVHGNADIGRLAAMKLLEVEPENAGTYLLLSNIFASAGKWREAANVRLKMKDEGLKKQPGCSWIEIGNRFHVFVVGDKSHDQSKIIHSVVWNLHVIVKKAGFVVAWDDLIPDADLLIV